jgi:hypothetical protein
MTEIALGDWVRYRGIREPTYDEKILYEKILATAGDEVVVSRCPETKDELVRFQHRGHFADGRHAHLAPGEPCDCHGNASRLWDERDGLSIATGYALSDDGLWRQHSWCVGGDGIPVETTEKRVLYFGYVLTEDEANEFYDNNAF